MTRDAIGMAEILHFSRREATALAGSECLAIEGGGNFHVRVLGGQPTDLLDDGRTRAPLLVARHRRWEA